MITQQQTQKQQLRILPQQIQLLNLYFLNALELEQRIQTELSENPLLETKEEKDKAEEARSADDIQDYQDWEEYRYDDVPDYRLEYRNYFNEADTPNMPIKSVANFREEAKLQLRMLTIPEEDMELAHFLIDVLNDRGMMDKAVEDVADDYSFLKHRLVDPEEIKRVLSLVQTLDPVGIGSRNVRECLLMQLSRQNTKRPDVACALHLIENCYDELMHRQFEKIQHMLNLDEESLRQVLGFIGGFNFYPATDDATAFEAKNTIIPDYMITRHNDMIQVSLFHARADNMYVNQSLYRQLSFQSGKDRNVNQYVRSKLQSAEWFVNAVRQRENTMLRIMECIVSLQEDYFTDGDISKLKPMVLRNVAAISGYDISTISRITSNKYADTHFGLVYLKDLFSEGIADKKGAVISNRVIQSVICETIDAEDKKSPFTDQQLTTLLSAKGYNIARRTVAKYREQLRIPIAQIRAVCV